MKRLILLKLAIVFIATSFLSHNPPGWYQQQLPVSNTVTDISFVDSLRGWVITERNGGEAYILHTTNGGDNWTIQLQQVLLLASMQFVDSSIGYVVGSAPPGIILKTTNGGDNWVNISNLSAYPLWDVKFVNKDTGWICSNDEFDGGVFKTTDGGTNWQRQTVPSFLRPIKLFFLNRDIGWALNEPNSSIYKTTNGGTNWLFLNGISNGLRGLFFLNNDTGWIIRQQGVNSIIKTTNGGANWFVQIDPNPLGSGPMDIFVFNNSKGWIAAERFTILSLVNDSTWGKQEVSAGFYSYLAISMIDTNKGFAAGGIFLKTDDGGGAITGTENNSEIIPENFTLYQNYPNPFNPKTIINYELRIAGYVKLSVYNIEGKELRSLVNKKQSAGNYEIEFDGSELSSGIYFYKIEVLDERTSELFVQTKKMILIR